MNTIFCRWLPGARPPSQYSDQSEAHQLGPGGAARSVRLTARRRDRCNPDPDLLDVPARKSLGMVVGLGKLRRQLCKISDLLSKY
jgi:hypothetical protein